MSQSFPSPMSTTALMMLYNKTFSPTTPSSSSAATFSSSATIGGAGLKWGNNETILPSPAVIDENLNQNETLDLPLDMQFNDGHLLSIIVYSILMVISAVGNLSVLNSMIKIRMKARLNRVNLLLMHLAIADLFVTTLMMPLEIGWNITVSWRAGDFMCRFMSFFRTFGLFLSGFIVVCISFDRYFAVLRPLSLPEANKRGRLMLYLAWGASVICSLPQSYVFHLEHHPKFTWYEQCITHNSFSTPAAELAYNFFGFTFMYGLPMVVIIFCYASILYEIFKVNALRKNGEELRRSSMEALTRAKVRTLKMTVVISATFFACWTPYNVMSLWYWFDKSTAELVDPRIQKGLFLFACTNSCVNPLIYGLFHIRSHQRRKSEMRIRQTLIANNCRLEQIDRPPYGVRVRWKPRDCLCPVASGSSSDNSKLPPGDIPMVNRNLQNNHQGQHSSHRHRRATRSTAVDNLYGSQRRTKTTTLIPLTSREFNRHVPHIQEGCGLIFPSKQNGIAVVNNNHMNTTSPMHTTSFIFGGRRDSRKVNTRFDDPEDGSSSGLCTPSRNNINNVNADAVQELTRDSLSTKRNPHLSESLQLDLDMDGGNP